MILYIDTKTNAFVNDPKFKARIQTISFKRGDAATVDIGFVEGDTITAPLSGGTARELVFGVKIKDHFDGDYIVTSNTYTIDGDYYKMTPSFNTTALNALLSSGDGNENNDIPSVTLMAEITWSDDSGLTWSSSNTIPCIVYNDVIKGNESSPTVLPTPYDWMYDYSNSAPALSSNFVLKNNGAVDFANRQLLVAGPNVALDWSGPSAIDINVSTIVHSDISTEGRYAGIFTTGSDAPIYTSGQDATITTAGSGSSIFTMGEYAYISTQGNFAQISTSGTDASIVTNGERGYITTQGGSAYISTGGENAPIFTSGSNAPIYTNNANIGVKTSNPTQALDINSDSFRLRNQRSLSASNAPGEAGTICYDSGYVYVCIATNTWKRSSLSAW